MIEEILAPLGTTATAIGTNAAYDLVKAVWSYFGIKAYLSFNYSQVFEEEQIVDIHAYLDNSATSGDEIFWGNLATGKILEGTRVRLFNFQVSPWFPRKPGTYWTYLAALARREALRRHIEYQENNLIIFDTWGKTLMSELGGIGSVNIRKNRNKVPFTLSASGHTDRGVPIICPPSIWSEIAKALQEYQRVEIDVKGTIQPLPLEYDSYFLRSSGIPKIAVSIDSILNLEIKHADLNVFVSPWTLFETSFQDRPYGFTYRTHNLGSDSYEKTVQWIEDYVDRHNGTVILTDFDEEKNSLNATFPLNRCIDGAILDKDVLTYCQQISQKFKRGQ